MAASPESLISRILNGEEDQSYDFVVLDSEAFNSARYDRPMVLVDPMPRRRLGKDGSYYRCKFYSGNPSEEAILIDQATYDNIEAQILIAQFHKQKNSFLAPKQNLQPIDRGNVESLTDYINKLDEKVEKVTHPLILERLRQVRIEAQQLRNELLFPHYKERVSELKEKFSFAGSSSETTAVKKFFSSKERQKFRPIDSDTFHDILNCLVEMSKDRQMAEESEGQGFDDLLNEIKWVLRESIQRQLEMNQEHASFTALEYICIILKRMSTTEDELTHKVLSEVLLEINEFFLGHTRINFLLENETKSMDALIGYISFLFEHECSSERAKEALFIIREKAREILATLEQKFIMKLHPNIEERIYPLHHLVERGNPEGVRRYVSNLKKENISINLEEKNLKGESIEQLARMRNDPGILDCLSLKLYAGNNGKKGKAARQVSISKHEDMKEENNPTVSLSINLLISVVQKHYDGDINKKDVLCKLLAIRELFERIERHGFDREVLDPFIKYVNERLKSLRTKPEFSELNDFYRDIFCEKVITFLGNSQNKIAQDLKFIELKKGGISERIDENSAAIAASETEKKRHTEKIEEIKAILADLSIKEDRVIKETIVKSQLVISNVIMKKRNAVFDAPEVHYLRERVGVMSIPALLADENLQLRDMITAEIAVCSAEIAAIELEFNPETQVDISKARLKDFIEKFHRLNIQEWNGLFLRSEFTHIPEIIETSLSVLYAEPPETLNVRIALETLKIQIASEINKFLVNEGELLSLDQKNSLWQFYTTLNSTLDSSGRLFLRHPNDNGKIGPIDLHQRFEAAERKLAALQDCLIRVGAAVSDMEIDIEWELEALDYAKAEIKRAYHARQSLLEADEQSSVEVIKGLSKKERIYQEDSDLLVKEHRTLEAEQTEGLPKRKQRLDKVLLEPLQLFLVRDLQTLFLAVVSKIEGIVVLLDDNNNAMLLVNGKPIVDQNEKRKCFRITSDIRGDIPKWNDGGSIVQACDAYESVCAVTEYIAEQEQCALLYDVAEDRLIKQEAAKDRVAREKARVAREKEQEKFSAIKEQVRDYEAFKADLESREQQQRISADIEKEKHRFHLEEQFLRQVEQGSREEVQQQKLATCKECSFAMKAAKTEVIQDLERRRQGIQKQRAYEAYGATTLSGAIEESAHRQTLERKEDLILERSRLEKKLAVLKRRYEETANFYHSDIAVPLHRGDRLARMRVRDNVLVEIDLILENLNGIVSEPCNTLRKALEQALSYLESDDVLWTDRFMRHIDALTESIFDFIETAQLAEADIVDDLNTQLLPLLFQGKRESPHITAFRKKDAKAEQVEIDLRGSEEDRAMDEKELQVINDKLQLLKTEEQISKEIKEAEKIVVMEKAKIEKEQAIPRLEEKIILLHKDIARQEEKVLEHVEAVRAAQERRRKRFIGKIDIILDKLRRSHEEIGRVPGKELLVVKRLEEMRKNLQEMENHPTKDIDGYFRKLHAIKANITEQSKVVQESRSKGWLRELFTNKADKELLDCFTQCIELFPEQNEAIGTGKTIQNLHSFETLARVGNEYKGAVVTLDDLEKRLQMAQTELQTAQAELSTAPTMQRGPVHRVRRNLPERIVGTFFSFIDPSTRGGGGASGPSVRKGPTP